MGSSENPKSFTLSDPLLTSAADPTADDDADADEDYPPISYNDGHRPLRDLPFLLFYLLLSLSTFALGILSVARRNPNSSSSSSFSYDLNTSSCVSNHSFNYSLSSSSLSSTPLLNPLLWTLVVTALLSAPIALSLLFLLRRFAKQLVYSALPLFILVPSFLNVYWFVACAFAPSCRHAFPLVYRIVVLIFVFLLIAVVLWIIVSNWHRVELTIRIVRVAAVALGDNIGLVAVLPALGLGLVVYIAPIVVFLVFARVNGRVVPREREGSSGDYYYCEWEQDRWVPAYFALAIITIIWSLAAMVEAQVYVVSGTIAQWYFSKDGMKPRWSIRSSLRNAFGPSFGTVCFSGMLICAVRVIRAIVDIARREDNAPGFVNLILQCCARFFLTAFDFVNKFTINFAAVTGESYCSSAKMTYELLKRNLLSAVFVETVSTRILMGITFVLSALYAISVYAILKAASDLDEIYFVAALAWLLLIAVLGYFVRVLDDVIDTIYVCYAIDRDKGDVCKQEVHEVYVQLPVSRNHRPILANRTAAVV